MPSEEEHESFYFKLQLVLEEYRSKNTLIVGDLNAELGKEVGFRAVGK